MSKSHVWCEVTMFHKSQKNIIITRFFHRFFMDKSLESHHTLKKKWINGNGSKFHTSTTDWNVYLSMMVSSDLTHTQMAVSWVIGATPSHHMSSIFVGIFHEKTIQLLGIPHDYGNPKSEFRSKNKIRPTCWSRSKRSRSASWQWCSQWRMEVLNQPTVEDTVGLLGI